MRAKLVMHISGKIVVSAGTFVLAGPKEWPEYLHPVVGITRRKR